jgi:hypothetical protein
VERFKLGTGSSLADLGAFVRKSPADLGLNGIEPADPIEGFGRDR